MSFCPNCGNSVDGRFCQKCGSSVATGAGFAAATAAAPESAPPPAYYGASQPLAPAPAVSAGLTENAASALCYLFGLITGIIFLVIAPYNQNPRVRFHAFQSIFFHLAWVGSWFVIFSLHFFLPLFLSILLSLCSVVVWFGGFVLWLFLMWKAYQGQRFSLPVIGAIALEQAGK